MGRHVIVGAGPVGTATAHALVGAGHEVTIVTRSGSGPTGPGITRVAADASDPLGLAEATGAADALYNCANPPYHRWSELWPPMAVSMLEVAARSGAVLVIMGNLYGYGPLDHPIREDDPLAATGTKGRVRVAMWEEAIAAHRDGRVRVTEARASDFFGSGVVDTSHFGRNVSRLLAGGKVRVLGDPDAPHSWTYVPDVGRTLAVLGTDERAWGRPWHVPTGPALSQRELAVRFCAVAGAPSPSVAALPAGSLTLAGVVSAQMRELKETRYQFDRPFIIDSAACTATFAIESTPLDDALTCVADDARDGSLTAAP
jgi:nucleoside-diphosphate-sugar epimerase